MDYLDGMGRAVFTVFILIASLGLVASLHFHVYAQSKKSAPGITYSALMPYSYSVTYPVGGKIVQNNVQSSSASDMEEIRDFVARLVKVPAWRVTVGPAQKYYVDR